MARVSVSDYLNEDNKKTLHDIGYHFGDLLGKGGYGAAFKCTHRSVVADVNICVKQMAAKIVHIEYTPDLRVRKPAEMQHLSEYENINIKYKIKGNEVIESVKYRVVRTVTPHDMVDRPMLERKHREMRRQVKCIETELQAMQTADHHNVIKLENIIRFYDQYSANPSMTTVVMFMELAECDLSHHLNNETHLEEDTKPMIAQICSGVAHLHSRGVAHMDLKPENILVFSSSGQQQQSSTDVILKITDFGISFLYDPKETPILTDKRGTPLFCCPSIEKQWLEVENGERTEICYDPTKSDVWAIAVITVIILFGKSNIEIVFKRKPFNTLISDEFLRYVDLQPHSQELVDLLKQVFVEQQRNRIDITQFCEHQWLADTITAISN